MSESIYSKGERYVDPAVGLVIAREAITGGLAEAIAVQHGKSDAELGMHRTKYPKPPLRLGFGTYGEQRIYTQGCAPAVEFSRGIEIIGVVLNRGNGEEAVVSLMRTPVEHRVSGGLIHRADPEAGEPGDFLMDTGKRRIFLDFADLEGVVIQSGSELELAANVARDRQLATHGTVIRVNGYR